VKRSMGISIAILLAFGVLSGPAYGAIEGWEPRIGFVNIESDIGSSFIFALTADFGEISENIFIEGTVDFWTKGYDETDGYSN